MRLNLSSPWLGRAFALILYHTRECNLQYSPRRRMRIGELSAETSVSIQTLRYYERRGLLPAPHRRASGFRVYDPDTTRRVRFIRRAQDLGFTLQEIGILLAFWGHPAKACGAVEQRARDTLERI